MSDEPTPTPEEAPPAQGFIDRCPRCRGEQQEGTLQLRSDSPPSGELRIECLRCKAIHMVTIGAEPFDEDDWEAAWKQAAGQ